MTINRKPQHDWHLQEWARSLGKKQNSLVTELGWEKNAAHRIWHGKQPYRRDIVNELSAWLQIRPYELLMPPDQAHRLRSLERALQAVQPPPVEETQAAPVVAIPRKRRA